MGAWRSKLRGFYPLNFIKAILGLTLNLLALVMPYSLRVCYIKTVSFFIHLPYWLFGRTAKFLMKKLDISPEDIRYD